MPILARVYHVPIKEQPALTLAQFRRIQWDYQQLRQREGGDG